MEGGSGLGKVTGGIRTFTDEVRTELKKSSWPTRGELVESTFVIIVTVVIIGFFTGVVDQLLERIIRFLVR
jgi:preprotein translocase subunit SecE